VLSYDSTCGAGRDAKLEQIANLLADQEDAHRQK